MKKKLVFLLMALTVASTAVACGEAIEEKQGLGGDEVIVESNIVPAEPVETAEPVEPVGADPADSGENAVTDDEPSNNKNPLMLESEEDTFDPNIMPCIEGLNISMFDNQLEFGGISFKSKEDKMAGDCRWREYELGDSHEGNYRGFHVIYDSSTGDVVSILLQSQSVELTEAENIFSEMYECVLSDDESIREKQTILLEYMLNNEMYEDKIIIDGEEYEFKRESGYGQKDSCFINLWININRYYKWQEMYYINS